MMRVEESTAAEDLESPEEELIQQLEAVQGDVYFAALPPEEIGPEIMNRIDSYYQYVDIRAMDEVWDASYRAHFGMDDAGGFHKSGQITFGGEQGELTMAKVNVYRSLLRQLKVGITKTRPAFEPMSINSEQKSLDAAKLADELLQFEMRDKRIDEDLDNAAELALMFGEGYIAIGWDSEGGDELETEEFDEVGQPVTMRRGGLTCDYFAPIDVVREWRRPARDNDWYVVRRFRNKYDFAARYPEHAAKLVDLVTGDDPSLADDSMTIDRPEPIQSDDIAVYEFYHGRTDSVPEGRHMVLAAADIVMHDGPLPYEDVPVYRMAPGEFFGSCFGYSPMWDQMSLQQIVDAMYSVMTTNYDAHGVQNVATEEGSDIDSEAIDGMRFIKYPRGARPPEGINLTKMPEGIAEFIQMTVGFMETNVGVNAVVRGNPGDALGAGAPAQAMALMWSAFDEFNSSLEKSWVRLLEDVATGIVNMYKAFADVPQVISIAGVNRQHQVRSFMGTDLEAVERVRIEVTNPLTKNLSGRLSIAKDMLDSGMIESPHQYITFLSTGNLETLTESTERRLDYIRQENEALARGEVPPVVFSDHGRLHLQEHSNVLASLEARADPRIVKAVYDHCMQHIQVSATTPPELLQGMGIEPLLPPMLPANDNGGVPQEEAGPPPANDNGAPIEEVMAADSPGVAEAAGVGMPQPPMNPISGEPVV